MAQSGARNPATNGIGEVLEFMQQLWALDHTLQKLSRAMRARHGISGPERLVLRIVQIYPGISAGLVAKTLHVHPSTLTGVFTQLVRRGFLRRNSDPADGRRAVLHLTPKGKKLAAAREGTVEEAVCGALSRLPRRNVTTTRKFMAALVSELRGSD